MDPNERLVPFAVIVSGFTSFVSRSLAELVAPLHEPIEVVVAASLKVMTILSPFSGLPATPPALLVTAIAVAWKWFRMKALLVPVRLGVPPVAVIVWPVVYGPVIVTDSVRAPAENAALVVGTMAPLLTVSATVPVKPVTVELSDACAVT